LPFFTCPAAVRTVQEDNEEILKNPASPTTTISLSDDESDVEAPVTNDADDEEVSPGNVVR